MVSKSDKDQTEGGESSVFVQNGYEHRTNSLYKLVTLALALPLGGAFIGGIVSYRSGLSAVDERISNHRELNRKLDKHDYDIQNIKEDSKELGSRITDIERYINSKGRK